MVRAPHKTSGLFSEDARKALKTVRNALRAKEEVVEEFASLLDGALDTYHGQKREFALSLRGKISMAISEALGVLIAL